MLRSAITFGRYFRRFSRILHENHDRAFPFSPGCGRGQSRTLLGSVKDPEVVPSATGPAAGQSAVDDARRKPITNAPFIKNLFLGKFDTKMLIFPEALESRELEELNNFIEPIQKYFLDGVGVQKIDETGSLTSEAVQKLKSFGLFGALVPAEYGGLEQNATKFARLGEVFGIDESIGIVLYASLALGQEGLLLLGNNEQKSKYLTKLANGEYTAAFCLSEPNSGSDAATIETKARLSDDGKTYILNGEKTWVTNGATADLFTVFAKTDIRSHTGQNVERLTAFLVEKNFGGIKCSKPSFKSEILGTSTCSLHFENTPVPIENVLGSVGDGFKVAVSILNNSRYVIGSLCVAIMKRMLETAVSYSISRQQFGKHLKDFNMVQEMIARTALNIYAAESMTFMTAALMDSYMNPDASLEAAVVKIFASEALCQAVSDCMQIMGAHGLSEEQQLLNSRRFLLFPSTNEILRLFVSVLGIQHAGVDLQDTVRKLRDPLNNVGFVMRKKLERMKTNHRNPSLEMKLYNHVHPDLSRSGEALELQIVKFQYILEKYMTSFGDKVFEQQLSLKRFADIAIDFYACTSCLARASRSKCIGLKNNDHEIVLARTFTADAVSRIDNLLKELEMGVLSNGDENRTKIAESVIKNRGYAAEHPLTRNW